MNPQKPIPTKAPLKRLISGLIMLVNMMATTASVMAAEAVTEFVQKGAQKTEHVTVTGSRIARPEISQPNPLLTIEAQQIDRYATPDLGSILAELPAINATSSLAGNAGSLADTGMGSIDLRYLDTKRTLVLVNGKRHVPGAPGSMQVDLSSIPTALIERVEIITGGASAIYGSDAVSGVVNVILKDNYEGLELSATGSQSIEGVGAGNHTLNMVAGIDISDGRGNIAFFAGKERIKQIALNDLRQLDNWSIVRNPNNISVDDGVPEYFLQPKVSEGRIHTHGVFDPKGDNALVLDANGQPMTNCNGNISDNDCDANLWSEDYLYHLPGVERFRLGATFNYDLTDDMTLFSEFKFTRAKIQQQRLRKGFVWSGINFNDNAFLSDEVRQMLEPGVGFYKNYTELNTRPVDNQRELQRYAVGIEGMFSLGQSDVDYELFYIHGITSHSQSEYSRIIAGNLEAGLDSLIDPQTGQAVCRAQLPAAQGEYYSNPAAVDIGHCVAYNPFGFGQASQAAMDWITADTFVHDTITQQVFGGTVAGDLAQWLMLPGGPVGFSTGFEYRKEAFKTVVDSLSSAGVFYAAPVFNEFDQFEVNEGFVEFSAPVLAAVDGQHKLVLDAAWRYADYSHADVAKAWKLGVMYAPFEDFRLRATHGFAVRAPNLVEAFSHAAYTPEAFYVDPCDVEEQAYYPNSVANCLALGVPAGFEGAGASLERNGGNADLWSERAASTTVGFVWTPSVIQNFHWTVDYYEIEIEEAITEVRSYEVLTRCVSGVGGPDRKYCDKVERDPLTHQISQVYYGFFNEEVLKVTGLETEVRYSMPLELFSLKGDLDINIFASRLLQQEGVDRERIYVFAEMEDPQWQLKMAVTYDLDDLLINWDVRYIDRVEALTLTRRSVYDDSSEFIGPNWIPSITTHDLSFVYRLNHNVQLNAGVRNVFDKVPPGYTDDPGYDLVGRRAFVGVRMRFDD